MVATLDCKLQDLRYSHSVELMNSCSLCSFKSVKEHNGCVSGSNKYSFRLLFPKPFYLALLSLHCCSLTWPLDDVVMLNQAEQLSLHQKAFQHTDTTTPSASPEGLSQHTDTTTQSASPEGLSQHTDTTTPSASPDVPPPPVCLDHVCGGDLQYFFLNPCTMQCNHLGAWALTDLVSREACLLYVRWGQVH